MNIREAEEFVKEQQAARAAREAAIDQIVAEQARLSELLAQLRELNGTPRTAKPPVKARKPRKHLADAVKAALPARKEVE